MKLCRGGTRATSCCRVGNRGARRHANLSPLHPLIGEGRSPFALDVRNRGQKRTRTDIIPPRHPTPFQGSCVRVCVRTAPPNVPEGFRLAERSGISRLGPDSIACGRGGRERATPCYYSLVSFLLRGIERALRVRSARNQAQQAALQFEMDISL